MMVLFTIFRRQSSVLAIHRVLANYCDAVGPAAPIAVANDWTSLCHSQRLPIFPQCGRWVLRKVSPAIFCQATSSATQRPFFVCHGDLFVPGCKSAWSVSSHSRNASLRDSIRSISVAITPLPIVFRCSVSGRHLEAQ